MAGEKRTVLVESISYRGADDKDHVAHRGDVITVHPDGVAHFDWVQDSTREAAWARMVEADKPKPSVEPKPDAKK